MTADATAPAAPSTATAEVPGGRSAPPWELILLGLTVLSLALIPLEIHRAFGLPAHPLIIHVPVILVPLVGLAALALVARPAWMASHGVLVGVFAVAATVGTIVAVGAGEALRQDRPGGGFGNEAARLDEHAQSGETLRILVVLFTFALLGTLWARRRGLLAGPAFTAARVVVAGLAIASIFFVIRTGHLGAQLTWGGPGGDGGPRPGFRPPAGFAPPAGFTPPAG